jgi:hypothetical protein
MTLYTFMFASHEWLGDAPVSQRDACRATRAPRSL